MLPILLLLVSVTASAGPAECTLTTPSPRPAAYTLSFPEAGLDDPAAYEGYRARFFRDAADNTFQIYLKEREGRIVNLWADAANESAGFTVRDRANAPVRLTWASDSACVSSSGSDRAMEYRLIAEQPDIRIGHFVLGSMRVERDVQYSGLHLEPFGAPFAQPELRELVDHLARLAEPARRRHLALLRASSLAELDARLQPSVRLLTRGAEHVARIEQFSFDARNRLLLEVAVPSADAALELEGHALRAWARTARPLVLTVRITTNAEPLTPLHRGDIFNPRFFAFYDSLRLAHDRALAEPPDARPAAAADARILRFRLLERQVRGLELLSSREKLLAGLPNYATYFGRDMLVTALLMQPIWARTMNEHVIASVLRKLSDDGEVSHEEALGGQAIREHAREYSALLAQSLHRLAAHDTTEAMRLLRLSEAVLGNLQQVRENYNMVDDDFQLPVLAARYLADPEVPDARKRAFLTQPARGEDVASTLALLLRNLRLVADLTAAYVQQPTADRMIAFPEREPGRYHAASWRDSGAGYGNGRFAMDVNVIWVPQALESIATILNSLRSLGFTDTELTDALPALRGSVLSGYMRDPHALEHAIDIWRRTARHFTVRLPAEAIRASVARKLASLPANEAQHWTAIWSRTTVPDDGIAFLALSLDQAGSPIAVLNTDVATRWFLDDITEAMTRDPARIPEFLTELNAPFLPYPLGLFVERLGPLVANDAYATPDVWEGFRRDDYHSPTVVWGREVNMLLLGLMRQIRAAHDASGQLRDPRLRPYVTALEAALTQTLVAVEGSGLKHNELWSYRIDDGRLVPIRWGSSSDVQLWNLTNLAVEFLLTNGSRQN